MGKLQTRFNGLSWVWPDGFVDATFGWRGDDHRKRQAKKGKRKAEAGQKVSKDPNGPDDRIGLSGSTVAKATGKIQTKKSKKKKYQKENEVKTQTMSRLSMSNETFSASSPWKFIPHRLGVNPSQ